MWALTVHSQVLFVSMRRMLTEPLHQVFDVYVWLMAQRYSRHCFAYSNVEHEAFSIYKSQFLLPTEESAECRVHKIWVHIWQKSDCAVLRKASGSWSPTLIHQGYSQAPWYQHNSYMIWSSMIIPYHRRSLQSDRFWREKKKDISYQGHPPWDQDLQISNSRQLLETMHASTTSCCSSH